SNQAIAGVYAFKPKAMKRLYEHLEKDVKNFENKKGEVQITPSIQGLVDDGFKLISRPFIKGILDFGRPNRLLEGNKYLLKEQDNVIGGPIEKISNSSLTAPSFIGENVEIINCVIGPFCSIGDDCILRDCVIRDSVIGDGCVLERIITENSIIGDYVKLDDLIKNNLIIGDRSNIRSSK
ncbi:MAG: hypothetical protein GY870_17045, partial [archaeon]|nr:hypothetical protein [archaeon]